MKTIILFAAVVLVVIIGYSTHLDVFANAAGTKTAKFEELTKDPKFVKNMLDYMKKNHDFTQNVVTSMLKDPMLRLQLIGHMTENKDAMKQMTDMIKSGTTIPMKMDHSKSSGKMTMTPGMNMSSYTKSPKK